MLALLKQGGGWYSARPGPGSCKGAEFAPFSGEPAHTMTLVSRLIRKLSQRYWWPAPRDCPEGGYRIVIHKADKRLLHRIWSFANGGKSFP